MDKIKELEVLCKPIVKYLKEKYDPYVNIIITDSNIRVTRDITGIPHNTPNID
ncbi:Uncharacterised protein [[Clostridium] sordellii]|uniref:hypothetical protein n=1 Tax=Paraclostridium sordellii TaxID=1505 RepID=UPI0005DD9675|nr:hypothetical protein [Paeniclostridium sordellii]CEN81382.1 Uncharacterised protein [[Clostridium] sordellii] [Paeniclostridium sordellii]CEO09328.1 Uncharacterised protein [[Clostridium] sordellii] [Paeniclostridium sordellii]CEP83990.1 Uncharacterised protein [[Clostridium] sordellii] [Paeniclostridium sordellii]